MATRIVFAGGETLFVHEDVAAVVKALEDISPSSSDTVMFTRKAAHADPGTVEGKPVHLRPQQVLYVTPT